MVPVGHIRLWKKKALSLLYLKFCLHWNLKLIFLQFCFWLNQLLKNCVAEIRLNFTQTKVKKKVLPQEHTQSQIQWCLDICFWSYHSIINIFLQSQVIPWYFMRLIGREITAEQDHRIKMVFIPVHHILKCLLPSDQIFLKVCYNLHINFDKVSDW